MRTRRTHVNAVHVTSLQEVQTGIAARAEQVAKQETAQYMSGALGDCGPQTLSSQSTMLLTTLLSLAFISGVPAPGIVSFGTPLPGLLYSALL